MINTANYIPDHISNDGQYPRNIRQNTYKHNYSKSRSISHQYPLTIMSFW